MRVLGEGVNGGGDLCARPVKPFERGRPWLRWTRAPRKFNRENDYDWLGSGVYFWESNPARALDWARHLQKSRRGSPRSIVEPYVVGAVLELGYCLDLISTAGIESVKASYLDLKSDAERSDVKMPVNQGGSDLLQRRLDCAVINYMHAVNKRDKRRVFETVRGVFLEGKPIYETSGF
jgi:hypothetical protein